MGEEPKNTEVSVTGPGGVGARFLNLPLKEVAMLILAAGMSYSAMMLYQHEANAQTQKQELAATLKESNKTIADALRESNASQKEQTTAVVNAINRLERRTAEVACLSDPAMKNRPDARQFCKNITARDDR